MPPRKRAAATAAPETVESKRFRSAIDEAAEEWICPITTELAFDPVIAEDGQMYERSAIEELIRQQAKSLKSPMTNLPMGSKLFPSKQARNTIEKLVRSGAISGDKAERWLERLSQEEEAKERKRKDEELVKETKRKAEGGCTASMWLMSQWYYVGLLGLPENNATAFSWAKKGADLDDPRCLAICGSWMIAGRGTPQKAAHGLCLCFQAAALGSKDAACTVADAYWNGLPDCVEEDKERAQHWYRKVATNRIADVCSYNARLAVRRANEQLESSSSDDSEDSDDSDE